MSIQRRLRSGKKNDNKYSKTEQDYCFKQLFNFVSKRHRDCYLKMCFHQRNRLQ